MVPTDFPSSFKEFLASKIGKKVTIHLFDGNSKELEIFYIGEDYLVIGYKDWRGVAETHIIPFSQIVYISDYSEYSGHD